MSTTEQTRVGSDSSNKRQRKSWSMSGLFSRTKHERARAELHADFARVDAVVAKSENESKQFRASQSKTMELMQQTEADYRAAVSLPGY